MKSFSFGPFVYNPVREYESSDKRNIREWELRYGSSVLGTQTLRATARMSTVQEALDPNRLAFIAQNKAGDSAGELEFGWIRALLPAAVLTQDAQAWLPPDSFQLAHVVGIGSFTGVLGEKAAQLVGVSAQNFRKYTASATAKNRQTISFAVWHLLLQRLHVQGLDQPAPKQESRDLQLACVALESTLELVREANDYLKRLPAVPVTRQLITRIDNHLDHGETTTARQLATENAAEAKLREQLREAVSYSASGLPIINVKVQGETVVLHLGLDRIEQYPEEVRKAIKRDVLMQLYRGLELKLQRSSAPQLSIESVVGAKGQ